MAKKITIDIEVNGKMQKATLSAKKLRSALDDVDTASQRTQKGSRTLDRNLKGTARTTSNSTKEFSKMAQGMGGLVGAYATVAASVFALSAAFQFFKTAADLDALTKGQEIFASRTGVSMKLMTSNIQDATGGLIAFKDAAQAAAIGQAAGLTADQMERLGKVAKNAGTILGRDVTDSFNRLTRGAIKAEPELLDELGIIIRINDASEAYGRTIKKNAQDLTQFEKSQAVVNAVLEQGESKFKDIGNEVNQVAKFGAAFQDTFKKLSEPVADVANFIAGALQDSILAVSAVMGILGLNIVKAFAPAGPGLKNTAEEGVAARKRLMEAAQTETDSVVAQQIRQGEFTDRNLKYIEKAAASKTSTVMNLSKMERGAIERDLAIIRAQNLRMTMHGQNVFKQMITSWRIQSLMFQAEYGKIMGRLKMYTAAFAAFATRALSILSFVGIGVMLVELGKQARKAFFISPELRAAEEATEALTKSIQEQMAAVEEAESSLEKPTDALNSLNQQLGLVANFSLTKVVRQVNELREAIERLDASERKRAKIGTERNASLDQRKIEFTPIQQGDIFAGIVLQNINTVEDLNTAIIENAKEVREAQKAYEEYHENNAPFVKALDFTSDAFFRLKVAQKAQSVMQDAARANMKLLVKDSDEARQAIEYINGLVPSTDLMTKMLDNLTKAGIKAEGVDKNSIAEIREELGRAQDAFKAGNMGLFQAILAEIPDKMDAVTQALNKAQQTAARLQSTFQGLTNAAQAFGDGAQKFMPKESAFSGVFDALDEIDNNLTNLIDLNDKIAGRNFFGKIPTLGELTGGKDSELGEEEKSLRRIFEVAVKGREDLIDLDFDSITVQKLQELALEKRNKLAEAYRTLEVNGVKLAIQQSKEKRQTLSFEQGFVSAKHKQEQAQHAVAVAEQEYNTFIETGLNLTEEQIEAQKLKVTQAEEARDAAQQELDIQAKLKPLLAQKNDLQLVTKMLNVAKEMNAQLEKTAGAYKQISDLNRSMAEQKIEEEIADLAAKNPFFDKERATAEAKVAVEKAFLEERQKQIELEYNNKIASINIEYGLLAAKRELALLELQVEKEKAAGVGTPEGARQAAILQNIIDLQSSIDYESPRQAAILLAEKSKEASLYGLGKAYRDAVRTVEALDPMDQVLNKAADSFRSGLNDAINGVFDSMVDGTKKMSDALKDAAKSVLQTIQKEVTQRLIVDPLLNALFGEDPKTTAIANAHTSGMAAGVTQINAANTQANTNTKTTLTTGANQMKTALSTGAADLKNNIINALNTGVKIQCCDKAPEPPLDPTSIVKDPSEALKEITVNAKRVPEIYEGGSGTSVVKASDPAGPMEEVVVKGLNVKSLKGAFKNFTGAFSDIFDKNIEGGFLEKLGIAFEAGGGLFSSLFKSLPNLFSNLFGGLFGGGAGGGGFGQMLGSAIGSIFGPVGGAIGGALGGMLGFGDGGITPKLGYASGGVARGPRSGYAAVLHGNEAVVPLPDGNRIPVDLKGAGNSQQNNVTVNVSIDGNGGVSQRSQGDQQGMDLGKVIANAVQTELMNQKRAGGILSPHGVS